MQVALIQTNTAAHLSLSTKKSPDDLCAKASTHHADLDARNSKNDHDLRLPEVVVLHVNTYTVAYVNCSHLCSEY